MNWKHWLIVLLIALNAAWMVVDGTSAIVYGDYVTPASGEYAGQLGPWANLVKAIGIEPRSALMKFIFIGYGLSAMVMIVGFVRGLPWARAGLIVVCALGLWYLPLGTLANLIALPLLSINRMIAPTGANAPNSKSSRKSV